MTPAELLALRTRAGLGQAALARLLGVSHACIYRYEAGQRRISPMTALAIAHVLNCERAA